MRAEPRDSLLLTLQVYGFLLGLVFGAATRAVPTFFAHRPPPALLLATWLFLQFGLSLFAGETLMQLWYRKELVWLQVTGLLSLSIRLLGLVAATGSWKSASRLRATARSAASVTRAAFFWCTVAGLLNTVFALQAWASNRPLPGNDADSVWHILTVGVVTTLIVGMAHLVVPALTTQWLTGATARRRLFVLQSLLVTVVLLRAVPPLVPNLDGRTRFGLMGPAGLLAWLAIAPFAWVLWQARHGQGALLAELTPVSRASAATEPDADLDR